MEEQQGRVGAALVEGENWLWRWIERLFPDPGRCCHICEKAEEIAFGRGHPPEVWRRGRLFSPEGEFRWQMIGDGRFRVQFLCEGEFPSDLPFEVAREPWRVGEEKQILLWGERKGEAPYWVEVRVPRELVYPLEGTGQRAAITAVDYLGPRGAVQFIRFKEVKRYGRG